MSTNSSWYDTPQAYGPVSRALHWSMALLFLWQYVTIATHAFGDGTEVLWFSRDAHKSVGLLLLVLVAIRGLWAIANLGRRPPADPGWLGRCAVAGHLALYVLMIFVPAVALLRQLGSGRAFAAFGLPIMDGGGERVGWMVAPASLLHGPLAWALLALVAGHVAMALLHQFVWRDGLLLRMWGRRSGVARRAAAERRVTGTP